MIYYNSINLQSRLWKNISWIFFGNIVHAVLSFLLTIYAARILSVEDNGMLNYVIALMAFCTALSTLGLPSVITRFFAIEEEKAGSYLATSFISRFFIGLTIILFIQLYCYFSHIYGLLRVLLSCYSLILLFSPLDSFVHWYRYKNKANIPAVYRIVAFLLSAIWKVAALFVFHSVVGYTLGIVLETAFMGIFLLRYYLSHFLTYRLQYSWCEFKQMFGISYPFILSSLLVTIYAQADRVMLKYMVNMEAVAYYSVAVALAGAISIIPSILIEAFRPDIMEYKIKKEFMYRRRLGQLYAVIFWSCISYGICITFGAEPIIKLLYGAKYLSAVPALALVVWYTSFSFFGAINSVFMVAEKQTKWLILTTITGTFANIILNCLLIPLWQIKGAAVASLLTQFIANFLLMAIIPSLRKGFFIMCKGIVGKFDCE